MSTLSDTCHRTGVLCVILCFALGIANIFHLHWVILFSVFCLYAFKHLLLISMRAVHANI